MNAKELDKALRDFEKKHPPAKLKVKSLDRFVANIEKQLDKLEQS